MYSTAPKLFKQPLEHASDDTDLIGTTASDQLTASEAKAKYQLGTAQAKNHNSMTFGNLGLGLGADDLPSESDSELEGNMRVGDGDSASGMSGVM